MPLFSICIPTYNRPLILKDVLDSIFSQSLDISLYEVCVSDNAKTDENEMMIKEYFSAQPNLIYHRSNCEGFLNSIEALKLGKGLFLKLNNDTGKFYPGALNIMAENFQKYKDEQSCVPFFMMSSDNVQRTFDDFDSFLYDISYWSSWSSAFCIKKNNLETLLSQNVLLDKMFPHTSLLFGMTSETKYIIDCYKYIETIEAGKKGGYNLPETFGVRYIDMLNDLFSDKKISKRTLRKIKRDTITFITHWYLKTKKENDKYVYDFSHKEKYILKSFGIIGLLLFYYYLLKFKIR